MDLLDQNVLELSQTFCLKWQIEFLIEFKSRLGLLASYNPRPLLLKLGWVCLLLVRLLNSLFFLPVVVCLGDFHLCSLEKFRRLASKELLEEFCLQRSCSIPNTASSSMPVDLYSLV